MRSGIVSGCESRLWVFCAVLARPGGGAGLLAAVVTGRQRAGRVGGGIRPVPAGKQ
jgi:hypothetical protein